MKPRAYLVHIGIPIAFAVGVFIYALNREPFGFEMLTSVLLGGAMFYAAPHLLWAVVVFIGKLSGSVAHSGFIASTVALILIASFWFFPPDPSGLPMQWMLYWPLAVILQFFVAACTAVYIRNHAPNTALKRDRANRAAP